MTTGRVFLAISDPTRRSMLDLLRSGPRSAGEIVNEFPEMSQPGVSKHLRVLRESGVVEVEISAQKRLYSLKRDGFDELDEWISSYRDFWNSKLDSLKDFLDGPGSTSKERSKKDGK